MPEETQASPDVLALLNQDLSAVSTAMPLIKAGIYNLRVGEVSIVPSKNKPGKTNLKLKLVTQEKLPTNVDGEFVNEGWPIMHSISLDKTDSYDPARNIKQFRVAVLGAAGESGSLFPLEQYKDKVVQVTVEIQGERHDKETNETYPPGNRIKNFILSPK